MKPKLTECARAPIKWTANDTIRLAICIGLIGIALTRLALEFGWPGIGMASLAVLFIAGGMAS